MVKRSTADKVPYLRWASQGFVSATEGQVIDYDVILAEVVRIAKKFHVKEIAVDPWNATQFSTQLSAAGVKTILFDQKIQSGRRLTFLGRPAAVTNLPGLVAQKHKAATRVFWAERTGFWRCVLRSTLLRSTDTAGLTRESNAWLETRLRSSDEACADWLWAHDRWRDGDAPWHEEL
jgi:lauroyl/myristoyl acyltransferase